MLEIPSKLYRITSTSLLSAKDGYLLPHNPESKHGQSLPLISENGLCFVAAWLSRNSLSTENDGNLLLLQVDTQYLVNIAWADPREVFEFFAQLPFRSIKEVQRFSWPERMEDRSVYSARPTLISNPRGVSLNDFFGLVRYR